VENPKHDNIKGISDFAAGHFTTSAMKFDERWAGCTLNLVPAIQSWPICARLPDPRFIFHTRQGLSLSPPIITLPMCELQAKAALKKKGRK
jgi:hypothetical protein